MYLFECIITYAYASWEFFCDERWAKSSAFSSPPMIYSSRNELLSKCVRVLDGFNQYYGLGLALLQLT